MFAATCHTMKLSYNVRIADYLLWVEHNMMYYNITIMISPDVHANEHGHGCALANYILIRTLDTP